MLGPADKRKGAGIVVLLVLNAFLDFFSLASFFPLIFSVINPEFIKNNVYTNTVYHFLKLTSTTSFIIVLTIGVLAFVSTKNLINLWIVRLKARYAFGIRNDIASRALTNYLYNSFSHFIKTDYAKQLNTIANSPLAFANNLILSVTTIFSEAVVCLLILIGIACYDYKILLLILLIVLPAFILFSLRKKKLKDISNEIKETYPLTLKYASQAVEGFPEIKMYQSESYFYWRFQKASNRLSETFVKDQVLETGTGRLTEIIAAFMLCLLVIYAVTSQQQYQQTIVLLSIYAGASFRIIPSVNRILHALQQIRTHEYLFEELQHTKIIIPKESTIPELVFSESITLKNIVFNYPNSIQILDRITLTIKKGKKIAITGKSGAGKTTFLLTFLGLLPLSEGEIFIDNKLITSINVWQRLMGYVPQKPYIIDCTLTENIAFGIDPENIDHEKVNRLIQELGLQELAEQLSTAASTRIGEHGIKISGGQQQRLALARALYADKEILVLDEVTNQLHDSLELEIMGLLDKLVDKKKTIIMVTHKIARSDFFDTIYKLENGSLHKI